MSNSNSDKRIILRTLRLQDYAEFVAAYRAAYRATGMDVWSYESYEHLLSSFPEGQVCIEVDGCVMGAALSLIIDYADYGDEHTYVQVTDDYRLTNHNPDGDVLYGIEVFVHPECRGMRLGRRLYDARKELCENLNLRTIIAGGRIPGYREYADQMRPREYIERVKRRELYDPILTFQMSNGFHVKKILTNYIPEDVESREFATLIEWHNIYYERKPKLFNAEKQWARVALVQWQMRRVRSLDELCAQLEFFVDNTGTYQADFLVFPELYNAPLMALHNDAHEAEALRALADYTEPLREHLQEYAVRYNVNIITGGTPLLQGDVLQCVCYLCRRDGTWDSYIKMHATPSEAAAWGMAGGSSVKALDTDCGKIGIMIGYDVQFPEMGRLYADQGAHILFVPFITSTPSDYNRIRICARSRAIENECYVAIVGAVGNLPRVQNMDIQYAQSAVFSPSDFAFPTDAIVSQATPNAETTIVCDLNLELLKELHTEGAVRNLRDRRSDVYRMVAQTK